MGRHNTGKRVGGLLRALALLLPALLALILVRQTAFAKTYVITDGDRVVTSTPPLQPILPRCWIRPG